MLPFAYFSGKGGKCFREQNETPNFFFFFFVKFMFLQLFSEKISGAEGTKLDEEFQEMERVRK